MRRNNFCFVFAMGFLCDDVSDGRFVEMSLTKGPFIENAVSDGLLMKDLLLERCSIGEYIL